MSASVGAATAQNWQGSVSSDWHDGANWSGGAAPTGAVDPVVDTVSPNPLRLASGVVDFTLAGDGQRGIAIGLTGTGALTIANGADLILGQAVFAAEATSIGRATVTGPGSTWSHGTLVLGHIGAGTIRVEDRGVMTTRGEASIGRNIGARGTLEIDGAGSVWTAEDRVLLGLAGRGELTVANRAAASAGKGVIVGAAETGTGVATIRGAGSEWTIAEEIVVGQLGSGELRIEGGATVTTGAQGIIANGPSSAGSVSVTGDGSQWLVGDALFVGWDGAGTLAIRDGGQVEAEIIGVLGKETATPNIVIDGPGSELRAVGGIQLGEIESVAMEITGGGRLLTGKIESNPFYGRSYLGYLQPRGASASVLVSGAGSAWEDGNHLILGNTGSDAMVRVENGGTLKGVSIDVGRSRGLDFAAGEFYGQSGLFATGAGTSVAFENFQIGNAGAKAVVEITGGATVKSEYAMLGGGSTLSGDSSMQAFSDVDLLLAGTGTSWTNADKWDSGFVTSSGDLRIRVTDSALLSTEGDLRLGSGLWADYPSSSRLGIDDGGTVRVAGAAHIAEGANAEASVLLDGAGSRMTVGERVIVGDEGTGALRIANGARLSAAGVEIAAQAGSSGRLVVGGDGAAAAAGTLDAATVAFRAGSGELVFNHTGTIAFDAALSGAGRLRQLAGITELGADSSAFAGATFIDGGALKLTGTLGGAVTLASPAILFGDGAIGGDLTVLGGLVTPGTNAAGNIGALTVGGDLTFAAGATYTVNIAGNGTGDRLAVAGAATLEGGQVHVNALDPETSYRAGQTYTILSATQGVTGRFDSTGTASAFIDPTLIYQGDTVLLAINLDDVENPFADAGRTYNQIQAATGLDGLDQTAGSDALAVYNRLLMLSGDQARAAFDLASGEVHAGVPHLARELSRLFTGAMRDRALSGLAASAPAPVFVPLGYGPSDSPNAPYVASVPDAAWIAPLAGGGGIDGDGNAADLDWRAGGLAGGYQGGGFTGSGRYAAGVAFGYLHGTADVDTRLSGIDADSLNLGLYGAWTDDVWTLSGAAAYTAASIDTRRRIVFGGLDRVAEADYWNHAIGLSGEVARNFSLGGWTVSPLATLDAGWSGHGAARESGAGALDLTVASGDSTWLDTGLGLAASHRFATAGGGTVTLDARALWEHSFGDTRPDAGLAFVGSATGFNVLGPDSGRDRLRLGRGAGYATTGNLEFRARYDGAFSGSSQSHAGSLGLTIRF
jgi:T5SS/PEP-CTERM-associated repeat protein